VNACFFKSFIPKWVHDAGQLLCWFWLTAMLSTSSVSIRGLELSVATIVTLLGCSGFKDDGIEENTLVTHACSHG
jgi:hypothetical protein